MEVSETTNANLHYDSPEQIIYEIITLSSLPNSRWKNLLDLKLVKVMYILLIAVKLASLSCTNAKHRIRPICIES